MLLTITDLTLTLDIRAPTVTSMCVYLNIQLQSFNGSDSF